MADPTSNMINDLARRVAVLTGDADAAFWLEDFVRAFAQDPELWQDVQRCVEKYREVEFPL